MRGPEPTPPGNDGVREHSGQPPSAGRPDDEHSDGTPACVVDTVSHAYGPTRALNDVSLTIPTSQRVALVGPSGAGKTTLLRVLAGMLTPTAGRVTVHGQPLAELRAGSQLTELVGMIQQRLDLVPQLSVKHNVQAGMLGRWGLIRSLAALTLPVEQPAARAAVSRIGIENTFHRRVAELSGGERQRVALARLLVQNPRVVLADEPVASLDPARAEDLLGLLCDLSREAGRTLVTSLHVPELACRHFQRVVGLRAGRVAFDLPAAEVTQAVLDGVYQIADDGHRGRPPRKPPRHQPDLPAGPAGRTQQASDGHRPRAPRGRRGTSRSDKPSGADRGGRGRTGGD